jgi:type III restriction enzyme
MAMGTGKTLIMAACVLYLYEHGYRKFLFLVHQVQILEQARKNFTQESFTKYLFNKNGIKFNGRRVQVRDVYRFQDATTNDINFMFFSTPLLYNRLKEDVENGLTREDFQQQDIVIIADEAHRLNVETRRNKTAAENTEVLNWESAVMGAINARKGNMLLEFSATVDLANSKIPTIRQLC